MRSLSVNVRATESRDFEALREIYNQVIDERVATFNTEHIDVDGISEWTDSGIVLVAESGREVLGFVRSFPYRTRPCYEGVAHSLSMCVNQRGFGGGGLLMSEFVQELAADGKWKVLSGFCRK